MKNVYNFIWQVRYPVLLTPAEKEMAREVCIAFRQAVCLWMWEHNTAWHLKMHSFGHDLWVTVFWKFVGNIWLLVCNFNFISCDRLFEDEVLKMVCLSEEKKMFLSLLLFSYYRSFLLLAGLWIWSLEMRGTLLCLWREWMELC